MLDSVKFNVIAGMTASDVINSSQATTEQKAVAGLFEYLDGEAGFSEYEANAFNSATIDKIHRNKYSIMTKAENGKDKEILYKEGKYIKIWDYRNDKFAETYTRFIWNKKLNDWEMADDCHYDENGYFKTTYWATHHGKNKKVVETSYQGVCVPKEEKIIKYDKYGNVKSRQTKVFNKNGKLIESCKTTNLK